MNMCYGNKGETEKYEALLLLFQESVEASPDYRIGILPGVGYIAVIGKSLPDEKDGERAAVHLHIDRVMRTPLEMAEELLGNWRWQWYYSHPGCVDVEGYDTIMRLDQDMPEKCRETYFPELNNYRRKAGEIVGVDWENL